MFPAFGANPPAREINSTSVVGFSIGYTPGFTTAPTIVAFFTSRSGVGPASYQVRITSSTGETLMDTLPPVQPNAIVQGSGQF